MSASPKALAQLNRDFATERRVKMRATTTAALVPMGERAPRFMLNAALTLLLRGELTREQLAERLQEHHPAMPVRVDNIITRLLTQGYITDDGAGLFGLTEDGDTFARGLPTTGKPNQVELNDAERRFQALATAMLTPELLTRSPSRGAASPADLRHAPTRAGADNALALPSRIGDHLHYRDGRITTMDGTVMQTAWR